MHQVTLNNIDNSDILSVGSKTNFKVLVVDDDELMLNEMAELLADKGFKCIMATNARDALNVIDNDLDISVIITDIIMPEGDGLSMIRLLQSRLPVGRSVAVIVVSGCADQDKIIQALRLGAVDFIIKPISEEQLLSSVCKAIKTQKTVLSMKEAITDNGIKKKNNYSFDNELNSLKEQLQQAQKMEAMGRLAGNITHDFNNALSSILGYTSLALEIVDIKGDYKIKKYLTEIYNSSEYARDLVKQILSYYRKDNDGIKSIDLVPLISKTIRMLNGIFPSSIKIHARFEDNIPLVVCDSNQFQQIVMNLCSNASDAMNGKGEINLYLQRVKPGNNKCSCCNESITGEQVLLSITNEGYGLNASLIEKIFDPFYTSKKQGEGTGIGLSVVNDIMHSIGGHIRVESDVSIGTVFYLYFPI